MNPFNRTLKFVGVAAGSALVAAVAWYVTQPSDVAGFGDIGQEFFADFDDVTKATSLAVVDYDADQKETASFSVKQNDDGLWVIPSHHDYPAEAKDRLARTATSMMGVKKTAVQSRSKDDWKRYGVVDPTSGGAATAEERGTRLTLSDGSGNPLVDLIVGNEVEGRSGNYFVRLPENNTTYVSELDIDLSAKFSEWIEPDLLKISSSDIVKVVLDNYSVNEERGTVEKKELLEFVKEDLKTDGDWKLADINEEAEEFDNSPVTSIATQLDSLKIVGVRPKPEGLGGNMRVNPAVKQILQMQMQSQGYFIGGDKDGNERLYSNEGELVAGISTGVEYTLYFGEIARGTGKDIEVGLGDDKKSEDSEETDADEPESEDGPRRYLLVKVDFNESLLGEKPIPPLEPVMPEILKTDDPADTTTKEEGASEETEDSADSDEADDACGPQEETTEADTTPKSDETPKLDKPAKDAPADPKPAVDEAVKEATEEKAQPAKAEDPKSAKTEDSPAKKELTGDDESVKADKDDAADKTPAADESAQAAKADEPAKMEEPAPNKDRAAADDAGDAGTETAETDKPKADTPVEPEPPKKDPRQIAKEGYDAAVAAYASEKSTYETELKAFETKVEEGKEKVKELTTRFNGWYYVISSDSFEKFRIERKDVVSAKVKEEATDESSDAVEK